VAKDDSEERQDRYQRAGAAGAGALVGGVVGGPAGIIVGAALGPLFEPFARHVWTELGRSGQRRMGEALAAACAAGIPDDELQERISGSDRMQLLAGYALAAASRTAWDDKVRTLGRSLASGLLAEDVAQIDAEQLIVAALADIEAPHLSLLEFLVCWEPGPDVSRPLIGGPLDIPFYSYRFSKGSVWEVQNRTWTIRQIGLARPRLAPVVPSLLGTLQRHGLAVQNDNTGEAIDRYQRELESAIGRQHARDRRTGASRASGVPRVTGTRSLAPDPTWSPTELGEKVFIRFRDAGTELPTVWTSGPAD
jgi:hypothetical protein